MLIVAFTYEEIQSQSVRSNWVPSSAWVYMDVRDSVSVVTNID